MRTTAWITGVLAITISLMAGSRPCFAINTQDTGYKITSADQTIDVFSVCKQVKSSRSLFAPTKSSNEWNNFRNWAAGNTNTLTLTACPTCSDGIQNQGETGVDCGGPCPACGGGTCGDNICNNGENCSSCPGDCGACPACTLDSQCNDSNPCTNDSCTSGTCQHVNNTASCDDGNAATCNDTCSNGTCAGTACYVASCTQDSDCNDNNSCTDDSCIGGNCQHVNNGTCATYCGDGHIDPGENCDNGSANGTVCSAPYNGSCTFCSAGCMILTNLGPRCGDNFCDPNNGETCSNCPADCGTCSSCGPDPDYKIVNGVCLPSCGVLNGSECCPNPSSCASGDIGTSWDCDHCCSSGGCTAAPTCSDGIQNQGETGVDCGGPCAACVAAPTCSDGIQNQGETGVDCGGPCPACPECTVNSDCSYLNAPCDCATGCLTRGRCRSGVCEEFTSCCFSGETSILTPKGPVSIKKLSVGSTVLSWDDKKKALVPAHVGLLHRRSSEELLRVTFSNGLVLDTTSEHPFYDPQTGDYKFISEFKVGDPVFFLKDHQKKGMMLRIKSFKKISGSFTVYTLSVGGKFNNFFAGGVLVHNKCEAQCGPPQY